MPDHSRGSQGGGCSGTAPSRLGRAAVSAAGRDASLPAPFLFAAAFRGRSGKVQDEEHQGRASEGCYNPRMPSLRRKEAALGSINPGTNLGQHPGAQCTTAGSWQQECRVTPRPGDTSRERSRLPSTETSPFSFIPTELLSSHCWHCDASIPLAAAPRWCPAHAQAARLQPWPMPAHLSSLKLNEGCPVVGSEGTAQREAAKRL